MAQKSNLTIEVLSIIGGVLTAIFFLGFLALSSILRSETSCLIVGSILIITTLFVNRLLTKPFLDAMNITCYIAGCILAGYGMNRNMDVLFIVLIGISVVTMLLSKGFILTFLCLHPNHNPAENSRTVLVSGMDTIASFSQITAIIR